MSPKILKRVMVSSTPEMVGDEVLLRGWVKVVRDHGKITFVDLKDMTGVIQCVGQGLPKLSGESSIEVRGLVKKRPEKLINENISTGSIELEIKGLKVLSAAEELPFDMGADKLTVSLPVLLDYRPLSLKHPEIQDIFKVQEAIADSFRSAAKELHCMEVFTPTIAVSATEGGSEVFPVEYYDHKAYLIQSPQLYKQIAVGAFERVYLFSHAYRAEPSVTTRHLSEVVQMDCEIAFIESFDELLDALEHMGTKTLMEAAKKCSSILKKMDVPQPRLEGSVPRLRLSEALEIISKRTGRRTEGLMDLAPEDEVEICKWALEKHGSDFVTITHYPTKKRAFYTMPDPSEPELSLSYDLLFRGLEISSGAQRVHDYNELKKVIKDRGMDPADFEVYLQAFKYGMPPEGGFSFGLERLTMKLLELANVRQGSLFPRDMERVDVRLSTLQKDKKKSK